MAFVNAYLTKEERAEFKAKAIPNPYKRRFTLDPPEWTIDREQDVFLVWGGQDREQHEKYYFLLGWKGMPINVRLWRCLVKGSPLTWELLRLEVPDHLKGQRDEIIQILKDALKVWAYDGNPDGPFNQTTEVAFKF